MSVCFTNKKFPYMRIARPTNFPVDTLYVALWGCQVGQTYNGALWVLRMAYISNFEVDISALDLCTTTHFLCRPCRLAYRTRGHS